MKKSLLVEGRLGVGPPITRTTLVEVNLNISMKEILMQCKVDV